MASVKTDNGAVGLAAELLTRSEAAKFLRVSPGTLSRWAAERRGPRFVKLGAGDAGSVRYRREDLDQFVIDCTKNPK